MRISPVNHSRVYINHNINQKTIQNNTVAFKGETPEEASFFCVDMTPFIQVPLLSLQKQMLKDGFTPQDLMMYPIQGIGIHANKDYEDMKAMQRVYRALSKSYINEDVISHNQEMAKLAAKFSAYTPHGVSRDWYFKTDILTILASTNKYNEDITLDLMNDENFNNLDIRQAIYWLNSEEKSVLAKTALDFARQKGYEKDFSNPLAIMISEATIHNLPAIIKMLDEQEFLKTNEEFVADRMTNFLRGKLGPLDDYIKSDTMTLAEVNEVIELEEANEEDEDED